MELYIWGCSLAGILVAGAMASTWVVQSSKLNENLRALNLRYDPLRSRPEPVSEASGFMTQVLDQFFIQSINVGTSWIGSLFLIHNNSKKIFRYIRADKKTRRSISQLLNEDLERDETLIALFSCYKHSPEMLAFLEQHVRHQFGYNMGHQHLKVESDLIHPQKKSEPIRLIARSR